jgi:hypothetical protein
MNYVLVDSKDEQEIRTLTQAESDLINQSDFTEDEKRQELLKNFSDRLLWLRCPCNDKSLIFIGKKNKYYLINRIEGNRFAHDPGCSHYNERAPMPGEKIPPGTFSSDGDYTFFSDTDNAIQNGNGKPGHHGNNRKKRTSRLYTYLCHLLYSSKIVEIPSDSIIMKSTNISAVTEGSMNMKLGGIPLNELLWFDTEYSEAKRTLIEKEFPKMVRPHGLFLTLARSYERQEEDLVWKSVIHGKRTYFCTNTSIHHSLGNNNSGPFLILGLLTLSKFNKCLIPRSFVVPIVSEDHWIIVDSHNERLVANALLKSSRWWFEKHKLKTWFSKPLKGYKVEDEVVYPDFEIRRDDGKKVFIEVMGMDSEEYISRKERTITLMGKVAPVFKFDCIGNSDSKSFDKRLFEFCKEVFNYISKINSDV